MKFIRLIVNSKSSKKNLLMLLLIIASLFILIIGLSRTFYPYDVGHYEAGIWAPAELASQGINPYGLDITIHEPYTMSPYGILYYAIVGLGIKLFGLQFWFARALSLICVALATLCVAKLTHRYTKNFQAAMLSAILFLSQFPVQAWIGIQRPDTLALALSLLGITSALSINRRGENSFLAVLFQAIVLAAAILTRQTCVLPVLIVSLWYWFTKKHSRLVLFLALVSLFLITVTVWLNKTSGGAYVWQQYIMPSAVQKSFAIGLNHFITFAFAPVTVCLIGLCLFLWRNKNKYVAKRNETNHDALYEKIFLAYLCLSLLLAMVTASRYGSNLNYYLEVSAALSIVIPVYWHRFSQNIKQKYLITILILIGLSFSFRGVQVLRGEYFRWQSLPYFKEIVSVINTKTSSEEISYSDYPELVVSAQRNYFFNDFVQYDGRAKLQHKIYDSVMHSGKPAAIINCSREAPQGYFRYPLSQPEPYKFYKVFLHLHHSNNNRSLDSVVKEKKQ
ncbi:MAG: glycosyltransferase family 39 protein [Bacteroidetes bacterium]|nr:glycosyltransferase family 39 protein [Bacteroidota bacterium]